MFTIFLLLSALKSSSSRPLIIPTDGSNNIPVVLLGRELPECMNVARFRTLQDIIWGCLVTIFACTWVAVHPNLPGPYECEWTRVKRKVTIMVYAILAPELMTVWAMRQWYFSREIVKEFNKKGNSGGIGGPPSSWMTIKNTLKECFRDGRRQTQSKEWTLTHGFFLQMGGFMLCNGEEPLRVLEFEELKTLIADNKVDLPKISEDEINDRSKGDFLTKLFVVLQTTWFIFQCLARWATKLPVTELEVVTLAFAILNIITYGLWWRKPQNVLVAIPVPMKGDVDDEPQPEIDEDEIYIRRQLREGMESGWVLWIPLRLLQASLRPFGKLIGGSGYLLPKRSLRVPMFYVDGYEKAIGDVGHPEKGSKVDFPSLAIAFLFGALHLIPWSTDFPSTTERWLWRSSALVITIQPVLIFIWGVVNRSSNFFTITLAMIATPFLFIGIPLYFFARITLLLLAFTTLRDLPKDVYANVNWTTFVPHV